jgi:hypothetical protein
MVSLQPSTVRLAIRFCGQLLQVGIGTITPGIKLNVGRQRACLEDGAGIPARGVNITIKEQTR